VPLTGITLPFVSYGGSSLLASFVIVGVLLSISHRSVARRPDEGPA
jgi:cell division protein FtsW